MELCVAPTEALDGVRRRALRELLDLAYDGDFSDDDWEHACGGAHVWLEEGGTVACHAALVRRTLIVGGANAAVDRRIDVGYVEAVATRPALQRRGLATTVMRRVGELIERDYAMGALSTGEHAFYGRLGWERWRGETFVTTGPVWSRTPDDDDSVMVLRTARTPSLTLREPLVAEARSGDAW